MTTSLLRTYLPAHQPYTEADLQAALSWAKSTQIDPLLGAAYALDFWADAAAPSPESDTLALLPYVEEAAARWAAYSLLKQWDAPTNRPSVSILVQAQPVASHWALRMARPAAHTALHRLANYLQTHRAGYPLVPELLDLSTLAGAAPGFF